MARCRGPSRRAVGRRVDRDLGGAHVEGAAARDRRRRRRALEGGVGGLADEGVRHELQRGGFPPAVLLHRERARCMNSFVPDIVLGPVGLMEHLTTGVPVSWRRIVGVVRWHTLHSYSPYAHNEGNIALASINAPGPSPQPATYRSLRPTSATAP